MAMPWFKMYPRQFLTDSKVKMLTREHRSILMDLWCYCSEDGSIPADLDDLARLLGESKAVTQKAMTKLGGFFVADGDRLVSVRMRNEAEAYEIKCQKLRDNGTKGGRPTKPDGYPNEEPKAKPDGYANGLANGEPNTNQMGLEVRSKKEEKALPPKPPRGGSRRRTRSEILGGFQETTRLVLNTLAPLWHESDPKDGRKITINPQTFGENVDEILATHSDVTPELLIQAAKDYLAAKLERYKAPQYFFGPEGPWKAYVRTILTRQERDAAKIQPLQMVGA